MTRRSHNGHGDPLDSASSRLEVQRSAIAGLIPLIALCILFVWQIPIGQPFFLVYRYSPWWTLRLERALPAAAFIAVGCFALRWFERSVKASTRRAAAGAAIASYVALIAWSYVSTPSFVEQHLFNGLSPSHDGAFVLEARHVANAVEYAVSGFPERLQHSPEEMRGRRVLSNPPGVTLIAYETGQFLLHSPRVMQWTIDAFGLSVVAAEQRVMFCTAVWMSLIFTAVWGSSLALAYPLCRLWMPPLASAILAFACVFNPASLMFSPGKDPAQLCSSLAIVFLVFSGRFRNQPWRFAVGGAVTAAASTLGLIHLWIALIALCAGLAPLAFRGSKAQAVRSLGLFVAGFLGVVGFLYAAFGWNLVTMIIAVTKRYGEIQAPIITDPIIWTFVGLPMFLLFAGPALWILALVGRKRREGLGLWLLAILAVSLTYIYFFANNNETPRLWISFVPMLLLGLALRRERFRAPVVSAKSVLIWFLAIHATVTIAQWCLMDARESEWRLSTERMWD